MPELNIFKIYPRQKDNLKQLLNDKGIKYIATKEQGTDEEKIVIDLFFTDPPNKSDIKWIREINKVFNITDYKRNNYAAALLIYYKENIFAVNYGMTHFYLSRYCDYDFGIEFASKVLESFKIKNSKSFGGVTNKSILTYNNVNEISYDGGESVSFIKGEPINKEFWGNNISCGQSIKLRKRDFDITKLSEIISAINNTILNDEVIVEFPRSIYISNTEDQIVLKAKLINDIKNNNYLINISEQQLSGVDFIFSDKYEYVLNIGNQEIELDNNLKLEKINALLNEYAITIEDFLDIEVKAKENSEYRFSKRLIDFIDYVDGLGNYYLDSGKWYQFDKNYLKYLKSAVDMIKITETNEMEVFNDEEYDSWLDRNNYSRKKWYREKYLNHILENAFEYKNYDREFTDYEKYTVEFADLYKDDTFYAVKIGKPQKLNYVIDQSINAMKIIQNLENGIYVDGEKLPVKKFVLWIFIERQNNISRLSDINSIIFLMKLANWRKEILLAGFDAEVKISYRRNN